MLIYETTITNKATLNDLYTLYPSIFAGYSDYYKALILSLYGERSPVKDTEVGLTSMLSTLLSTITGWVAEKASLLGLDYDIDALLSDEIKNFETPETDVSSEVSSSRTTVDHSHAGEILKYMSSRLGLPTGEFMDNLDRWTKTMFYPYSRIIIGRRCPYY